MELFVGGLPYNLSENELENIFKKYGVTSAKIITDRDTGKSRGFGFVEIPDIAAAIKAVRECDGKNVKGRNIRVNEAGKKEAGGGRGTQKKQYSSGPKGKSPAPQHSGKGGEFPYRFCKRKTVKDAISAFHHKLNGDRYDIAFEIAWTALTPAALNPCTDITEKATMPENNDSEFTAYNKRWLMPDNHLLISPFTVKSAIANGFANVMGGCYRVIGKEEGHPSEVKEGQYYYKGGYKRYRVSMDNSKPGIIKEITEKNGNRHVVIQPVTEYYYDQKNPPSGITLTQGAKYSASTFQNRHKNFIQGESLRPASASDKNALTYYGKYRFGMNLGLKAPDLRKRHYHRFFEEKGKVLSATIPALNFKSPDKLKGIIYMGDFRHVSQPDPRPEHGIWYEDLRNLKAGEWVYYHMLNGKITNIGQNYQFKAMFLHEDAVPEDQKLCGSKGSKKDCLCPRCRMFGMTGDDSAAFKGRFKASALRNASCLKEGKDKMFSVPDDKIKEKVMLKTWVDSKSGELRAYQALMPIAGPPKPNKRDVNGYFDKKGEIKGAKVYKHGKLDSARNIGNVNDKDSKDYTHRLRNYAMVCEPELVFNGTVGAENASPEEIAALILLLDSKEKNHGFKLGLGKAFGMGSFSSAITKVWIRDAEGYEWKTADDWKELEQFFPVLKEIHTLKKIEDFKINSMKKEKMENPELHYPDPVANNNPDRRKYWSFLQDS